MAGAASVRALKDAIRTTGYERKSGSRREKDAADDRRDAEFGSLALRLGAKDLMEV